MTVAPHLNALSDDVCREVLAKCCASQAWVEGILAVRPFDSDEQLAETAARIWNSLGRADWLEAFAAHPRIGDVDNLRAKFSDTKNWASGEQAGVNAASEETLQRLAGGNDRYFAKFGYIFIVCATGKSADEMLALLEARLANDAATELAIAAAEQLKITQLRLKKLAPGEQ